MITVKDIAAIGGPRARADICAAVADFINRHGASYRLTTARRLHHFLGQTCVESGGFSTLEENLNYSVAGIKATFGRHRISTADCELYGAIKGRRPANKSSIANLIYGGAFGKKQLGNIAPGDGWEFRGSSIKQITGRANFRDFTKWIRKIFPSAPDFEKQPDLLRTLEWAVWPAVWYWVERGCYEFADKNDVLGLTKKINGGTNGLEARQTATKRAAKIIGSSLQSGIAAPQPVAGRVSANADKITAAKPEAPQRPPVPVYGPEHEAPPSRVDPPKQSVVKPAAAGGIGAAIVLAFFSFACSMPQWFIDFLGYAGKCTGE